MYNVLCLMIVPLLDFNGMILVLKCSSISVIIYSSVICCYLYLIGFGLAKAQINFASTSGVKCLLTNVTYMNARLK